MKALTAAEMREVDRLTTERYGIPSLQLMEAAAKKSRMRFCASFLLDCHSASPFSAAREIMAATA